MSDQDQDQVRRVKVAPIEGHYEKPNTFVALPNGPFILRIGNLLAQVAAKPIKYRNNGVNQRRHAADIFYSPPDDDFNVYLRCRSLLSREAALEWAYREMVLHHDELIAEGVAKKDFRLVN